MRRKILVVDDIATNRRIIERILESEYEVLEAENGKEACAILQRKYKMISAVILDIVMPVMDGYEVLEVMRANPVLSQLPVIVTTGNTDREAEAKALAMGANDFIYKPCDPSTIRYRIRNIIRLRESASIVNVMQRDDLTGLYNRKGFFDKAKDLIKTHARGTYIMACFDIDNFKVINDQYGSDKGDDILRYIADIFRDGFDTIGGICGRITADIFSVMYPKAFMETEEISEIRNRASFYTEAGIRLTFSIGRYLIDDLSLSVSAMYDRAAMAENSVKGRFDTHIAMYDESMRTHILKEQKIIGEMNLALQTNQFEVWFQPQYNHSSGALIGSEALVRWRHPSDGLVMPGDFISVFERNGFIYELDKYVWEQCCIHLRRELDEGKSALPVSVNISRYDIFRNDFIEIITGLLEKYNLTVDYLRLEITESAFAKSTEQIISIVKQLIEYGFIIEIDDFGSGYSSLNTLKDVPAQILKLDMKFLENNLTSQRGGNILESVVRMAKWIGMVVIAEGVETREQADYLKSIGCNYVQGYLYGKPMESAAYFALSDSVNTEEKMLSMETVDKLDSISFWDPKSLDALIFNSYVGSACIFEYNNGSIEMLRASDKLIGAMAQLGIDTETALGLAWNEHLDEESLSAIKTAVESSKDTKQETVGEYVLTNMPCNISKIYMRTSLRVIASVADRYLVYCINENITAQREAERKNHEISVQIETIMQNINGGVLALTSTENSINCVFANNGICALFGYTKEELLDDFNAILQKCIFSEDASVVNKYIQKTKMQIINGSEFRVYKKDGTLIWIRSNSTFCSLSGIAEPVFVVAMSDITKEKNARLEIIKTSQKLLFLNDTAHDLLALTTDEGISSVLNKTLAYFGGDRAFVCEYDNDDNICRITYEVCSENTGKVKLLASELPLDGKHTPFAYFDSTQSCFIESIKNLPGSCAAEKKLLKTAGAASLIAISLHTNAAASMGTIIILNPTKRTSDCSEYSATGNHMAVILTRRNTDKKMRDDNNNLIDLMNNIPGGFARLKITDGERVITDYVNDSFCRLRGMSRAEIMSKDSQNAFDGVHTDDLENVLSGIRELIKTGNVQNKTCRLRCMDGTYANLCAFARLSGNDDGEVFINAYFTEISAEQAAKQDLSPFTLTNVMEFSTDLSFAKDCSFKYICCSKAFAKMAGCENETDIIGKTDFELFTKETADRFRGDDLRLLDGGDTSVDTVESIPTSNGIIHYTRLTKHLLRDSQGTIVGIYGVGRNISEYKTAFEYLRLLTDNAPGGLAMFESVRGNLHSLYYNKAFYDFSGYTQEEYQHLTQQNPMSLVFKEDLPKVYSVFAELEYGKNRVADCTYRCHIKSGGFRWFSMKASVSTKRNDSVIINTVQFDITEKIAAEDKLRISEEQFHIAAGMDGRFVARYDIVNDIYYDESGLFKPHGLGCAIKDIPQTLIDAGVVKHGSVENLREFFDKIKKGIQDCSVQLALSTNHGDNLWYNVNSSVVFDAQGCPALAIIMFHDITDQREKEAVYRKWQQSLNERNVDSYTLYRCNLSKNTSFDSVEGKLLQSIPGGAELSFDDYTRRYASSYVHTDDCDKYAAALNSDTLLANYYRGIKTASVEYREIISENKVRWLLLSVDLVEYPNSTDVEAYLMYENIDEQKKAELHTKELSETDPLTGVLNRKTFVARLERIISQSGAGAKHALLMLDLDGFKQINDSFGHAAGDRTLIEISRTLRSVLRHEDLLGRLGGDEFVICLKDVPDDKIAKKKAVQIGVLTRKSFRYDVQISASIGIALYPRDGNDFDTLYHNVDTALYHVKDSGKDSYAFYSEKMRNGHLALDSPDEIVSFDNPTPKKIKRRILIVDDSKLDLEMVANMFDDEFLIEKAKDGKTALTLLRHYGSAISVVLLDLYMPGMDGFEVLAKMRRSRSMQNIPVVIVSGADDRETSLKAIKSGATDLITKPIDPDLMKLRVYAAISKAENELLRAQNSFLLQQDDEITKYRIAFERTGTVMIEYDWIGGVFYYDQSTSLHILGNYNNRTLWEILLSDLVADTLQVQAMQEFVHDLAMDRNRMNGSMDVILKTPQKVKHCFRMNVFKRVNDFQLTNRLLLTLIDTQAQNLNHDEADN